MSWWHDLYRNTRQMKLRKTGSCLTWLSKKILLHSFENIRIGEHVSFASQNPASRAVLIAALYLSTAHFFQSQDQRPWFPVHRLLRNTSWLPALYVKHDNMSQGNLKVTFNGEIALFSPWDNYRSGMRGETGVTNMTFSRKLGAASISKETVIITPLLKSSLDER